MSVYQYISMSVCQYVLICFNMFIMFQYVLVCFGMFLYILVCLGVGQSHIVERNPYPITALVYYNS